MPTTSSSIQKARPASLACAECRKHHLKCDGRQPSCSRCSSARLDCVFIPSRRGARRRQGNTAYTQRDASASPNPSRPAQSQPFERMPERDLLSKNSQSLDNSNDLRSPAGMPETIVPESRLVRLFYEHFHPAHPILVPASLYGKWEYPPYLHQVVKFIGSHYSVVLDNDILQESTWSVLSATKERTSHMVQALLLYSTIMRARNDTAQTEASLSQAIDIAIELGMNRRDFATTFSGGKQHEAESLRRTWWGLFMWEINMAVIDRKITLRCSAIFSDVCLPCEESTYASLQPIPEPQSLASFRTRIFTDGEAGNFSSFAYCIEAVRILARVLVLNGLPDADQDNLQAVANTLVSWIHHLPQQKVDIVDMYGSIDEMLFQAHFTIQYAAMILHLPRGNLRTKSPGSTFWTCPVTLFRLSPSLTRHVHDVKAIEASKKLSNLLSVRAGAQGYSPSVVFGSLLCGLVQLSATEMHGSECADHHQNRVVLVLGCLKLLKDKWSLAQVAYFHLRTTAAEMNTASTEYSPFESKNTPTQPTEPMLMENAISSPMYDIAMNDQFSSRLLSEYTDAACGEVFPLFQMFNTENLPNNLNQ
ncbi:hypothetical protein N7478_013194 [Penicillium angulare]|uniref:uncharacterized protein n=1 Tax=Penicillium angulare TaxID=116970 RepID=UPI0025409393|nr:uncharacterized protein N7478_013194 [Penicillium angulare]KAJ5257090.1 hypothetical protein N7478_013194 [Penicillium angulare]